MVGMVGASCIVLCEAAVRHKFSIEASQNDVQRKYFNINSTIDCLFDSAVDGGDW